MKYKIYCFILIHALIFCQLNSRAFANNIENQPIKLMTFIKKSDLQDLTQLLAKLVSIKTNKRPNVPQQHNPAIIQFGEFLKKFAQENHLKFVNYDNFAFDISLAGTSQKSIAFYGHADVVDAVESEWRIHHTQLNPYNLTKINNRLYGRGTIDDKGAISAALMALKKISHSKTPLKNSLHLIITTSEETSGKGIAYYKKRHGIHDINIGIDSAYPIQVGEDGTGRISLKFRRHHKLNDKDVAEITTLSGAYAYNVIPETATATLCHGYDRKRLKQIIKLYKKQASHKIHLKRINLDNHCSRIIVKGKSVHASLPEAGINPIPLLGDFLLHLDKQRPIVNNAFAQSLKLLNDLFGHDYYARKIGLNFIDKDMGPMLLSPTKIQTTKTFVEVGFNIRLPKGKSAQELKQALNNKLKEYREKHNMDFIINIKLSDAVSKTIDPEELKILKLAYENVTKHHAYSHYQRGYTNIHTINGAVSFGPNMPKDLYLGHRAKEFITQSVLLENMHIYLETMLLLQRV